MNLLHHKFEFIPPHSPRIHFFKGRVAQGLCTAPSEAILCVFRDPPPPPKGEKGRTGLCTTSGTYLKKYPEFQSLFFHWDRLPVAAGIFFFFFQSPKSKNKRKTRLSWNLLFFWAFAELVQAQFPPYWQPDGSSFLHLSLCVLPSQNFWCHSSLTADMRGRRFAGIVPYNSVAVARFRKWLLTWCGATNVPTQRLRSTQLTQISNRTFLWFFFFFLKLTLTFCLCFLSL